MPWLPSDAERHTKQADTPARRILWAKVANQILELAQSHGLADPEAHAIRAADAAVARTHKP